MLKVLVMQSSFRIDLNIILDHFNTAAGKRCINYYFL